MYHLYHRIILVQVTSYKRWVTKRNYNEDFEPEGMRQIRQRDISRFLLSCEMEKVTARIVSIRLGVRGFIAIPIHENEGLQATKYIRICINTFMPGIAFWESEYEVGPFIGREESFFYKLLDGYL
jgi:hypothetical protein